MSFLKNVWYLAAWSDEVDSRGMLDRTIGGEPLILFRDAEGTAVALLDRCPHRFAPLSRGVRRPDGIQCGYHGLAFGATGACLHNPHGPIVRALSVRKFPLVERHCALWVWLGAPGVADAAAIPDLSFIDGVPAVARVSGYLRTAASYDLMVDNIMDLTHADYLHPDTLGGGINTRAKARVEESEDGIAVKWRASGERLPPLMAGLLQEPELPGDFQNEVYWFAPGVMKQRLIFGPAGRLVEEGRDSWTAHVMTPETERATHYFFCHTSDHVTADPAFAPVVKEALLRAFQEEDAPMIEAQQQRLGGRSFEELQPALLATDAAAAAVRRRMRRMIESEVRSQPPTPQ